MVFRIARWFVPAVAAFASPSSGTAPTPAFGIYAYSPATWNASVAEHFPIVFVQYQSWARNQRKIQNIRELASSGSRVIVDFEFLKSLGQRTGRQAPPPVDDIVADADYLLAELDGVPLEGLTLDEENLTSPQRLALLGDLYVRLKRAHPDRRFLQWISATTDVAGLRRLDLGGVPADGWVMDPYRLPASDYAAYVRQMRTVSNRLYSIIWAAPNWQVGGGYRKKADAAWWNGSQWKVFYNRLAVNQANGIPSIFYLFTLDAKQPVGLWKGNKCDQNFYMNLASQALPYVRGHKLPLRIPATKPAWLPTYC